MDIDNTNHSFQWFSYQKWWFLSFPPNSFCRLTRWRPACRSSEPWWSLINGSLGRLSRTVKRLGTKSSTVCICINCDLLVTKISHDFYFLETTGTSKIWRFFKNCSKPPTSLWLKLKTQSFWRFWRCRIRNTMGLTLCNIWTKRRRWSRRSLRPFLIN